MRKLFFVVAVLLTYSVQAQKPAFYDEIRNFKKQDSLVRPPRHPILFVGSSSFRVWKSLQDDFANYPVINRGFGGSHIPEVTYYANDIIIPYKPKQIFIYAGDNDLAEADSVNAEVVFRRFKELFYVIRTSLPKAMIDFVSIKPSPSRQHLMPQMEKANQMIRDFLKGQRRTAFVDVYHAMLDASGHPRDELFIADKLHMNQKGYAIWKDIIQPFLIK